MECGALGQNGHLVVTNVGAGFDTENDSVITQSPLTMGSHALAADFRWLDAMTDIFVLVRQISMSVHT